MEYVFFFLKKEMYLVNSCPANFYDNDNNANFIIFIHYLFTKRCKFAGVLRLIPPELHRLPHDGQRVPAPGLHLGGQRLPRSYGRVPRNRWGKNIF